MPSTRHRPRLLIATLASALLLAGCGGSSHQPHVASLATPAGGSSGHSSTRSLSSNQGIPDPHGAPRESLDATNAQNAALAKPYDHCVGPYHYGRDYKAFLAAASRCVRLIPLPPWQYDPSNPQARAYIGSVVTCLQARGYHVTAFLYKPDKPFSPIWDVVHPASHGLFGYTARTRAALDSCQQQALR